MNMSCRTALLAGAMLLVAPAMALGAETEEQPAADAQASDGDGQIVVTARKRNETIEDVPVAITAITAEDREGQALDRMGDYLRQVPGAALVSSGPEYLQDITLRGQGSGRLGFSETATGIFRNGLYNAGGGFGGRAFSRMDVFDAERIEVLRGPQGAIYGRNSVGGAVDIRTQDPLFDESASLSLRYANPDRAVAQAIANVQMIPDRLALRVGLLYDHQYSGFYRNDAGDVLDKARYTGFRSAVKARVGDNGTLNILYEYSDSRAPAFGAQGQRKTRVDGTVLDSDPFIRSDMDRNGSAFIRDHLVTASYVHDLGGVTLNVRGLFKTRDGGREGEDNDHFAGASGIDVLPGAGVKTPDYSVGQYEDHNHWMVQAYLASSRKDAPISWMIGAEYLVSNTDTQTVPNFCPVYTGALLPDTPGCYVGTIGTLSTAGTSARSNGRLTMNNDSFSERLRSPSIFASAEVSLDARTKLEVAARVQRDRKDYDFMRFSMDPLVYFGSGAVPAGMAAPITSDPDGPGPLPASPVQFCPPTLLPAQCAAGRETLTASSQQRGTFFTPAVSLRHRFSRSLNAYVRFATGYRPGGFNTNLPPTTVRSQVAQLLNYEPEQAYSGELGLKGRFLGINFALAGYYVRTKNVQVVTAASSLSRGFILQNVGNAHVYGAELEARRRWNLGGGSFFQLAVNATTQGGAFEEGATALIDQNGTGVPSPVSLAGTAVPRLRKLQVAPNATLSVPLASDVRLVLNGGMQHAAGGLESPAAVRPYSGYTLFDARAGLHYKDMSLSVFAKNLTNKIYVLNVISSNYYYSEPRTYGVELKASF